MVLACCLYGEAMVICSDRHTRADDTTMLENQLFDIVLSSVKCIENQYWVDKASYFFSTDANNYGFQVSLTISHVVDESLRSWINSGFQGVDDKRKDRALPDNRLEHRPILCFSCLVEDLRIMEKPKLLLKKCLLVRPTLLSWELIWSTNNSHFV